MLISQSGDSNDGEVAEGAVCWVMERIPYDVLRSILELVPSSQRIPASFTCRRWLTLLAKSYPRTLELRVNLDASSCNATFEHSKTHETHVTICSCKAHAQHHAVVLKLLFEHCGDGVRAVCIDDDLVPKADVQCEMEDVTLHSVLHNSPASITALCMSGVNLTKVHAWTLALIAKFADLEEFSLRGCQLPLASESVLHRLIAPSFQSLTSVSITDTEQISDKLTTVLARRCPLLSSVDVSGCVNITALSLVALCESASLRRPEMTSINVCSTSFDFNMLERYLCSPLLVGGNCWVARPMRIVIGFDRAAVCVQNTRSRNILIIAYV